MYKKILKYYHTLKYLKLIQWRYRLYYTFRNKIFGPTRFQVLTPKEPAQVLSLIDSISSPNSSQKYKFKFLNLEKDFSDNIDWEFSDYGKLWTYNLCYFEYLDQANTSKAEGLELISYFISKQEKVQTALEPYPISLRGINWIKFFAKHKINTPEFEDSLYSQYQVLLKNLEYQHLANHLIENGFSLLFGAYFFYDQEFYKASKSILKKELKRQVLKDGAHLELSPMYHQIILYRVLDAYNLVKNNSIFDYELLEILKEKAGLMLSWMKHISFESGDIPHFNDSAPQIAPSIDQLLDYAQRLGIQSKQVPLNESGYRAFKNDNFELIMDLGNLGAVDYNLAHSHNDMLSFELHIQNKPVFVNTGISTYEKNQRRLEERQTRTHNTVKIEEQEQNEVWSGHRVAQRSTCKIISEDDKQITGKITRSSKNFIQHQRTFNFEEKQIVLSDIVSDKHKKATAFFHFHPDVNIYLNENTAQFTNGQISFQDYSQIKMTSYSYALGFNHLKDSNCIEVEFYDQLRTEIKIDNLKPQ